MYVCMKSKIENDRKFLNLIEYQNFQREQSKNQRRKKKSNEETCEEELNR